MDSAKELCSLFLCPGQHDFKLNDDSSLISLLLDIGFISKQIGTEKTDLRYLTGDHFLNHVSYMGCAPAIQFEASNDNSDDNSDFCFIQIHPYDEARLIQSKKQARAPHCPVCSKPVKDWQNHVTATTISCELCNTISSIETFDWRKMAGYACLFIEITDVFPKEAIPQQLLLDKLADHTDTEWQYFYSCQ